MQTQFATYLESSGAALLALLSGAALVLAFSPFDLFPLAVIAPALWLQTLQGRSPRLAFGLGWLFGIGLFGCGVFWIRISLNEFGNIAPPLAIALTVLFVAVMALYYGLAGWLLQRLGATRTTASPQQRLAGAVLIFPAVWVLIEWLRGWLFTGFPWLILGNAALDSPAAGWIPLLGVHGLSLILALSAGLAWAAWRLPRPRRALLFLAALWLSGGFLWLIEWTAPEGEPFTAAVIQGNIEQSLKWETDILEPTIATYLSLTKAVLGTELIVWPETAIPDFLHQVRTSLITPLAADARAAGSEIVLGIPIMDRPDRYYNSLISLGTVQDRYDKRHLVPFGEFLPFKTWLRPLIDWFEVPMSDFSPGAPVAPLLQVGAHQVGVSICYEDVFPELVREALPTAAYLINVSNDAWFGDSLAPAQHLQFARIRALENGRPLVRATNTGISAIIDHRGRIVEQLALFERGTVSAEVQPRRGLTPAARFGNRPALLVAVMLLLGGLIPLIPTNPTQARRLLRRTYRR